MFNLFKKKREDMIDLVALQKRGILRAEKTEQPVTSISSSSDSTSDSTLGFLGSLASASSDSPAEETGETSNYEYLTPEQKRVKLRTRIFDMHDKIERHSDEISDVRNILGAIDKRLERLERKTGVKEPETY